jgi:catechol 2,3-dioxygenase-like lactoylglutathione lyase family enzyme
MLHVGVTVVDVAAADRFYKDILGFSEIWRGGTTDDVTSWINMKVPDGTDYVEYMLVTGKVDRKRLGTLHHAALLVPDMHRLWRLSRAATGLGSGACPGTGWAGTNGGSSIFTTRTAADGIDGTVHDAVRDEWTSSRRTQAEVFQQVQDSGFGLFRPRCAWPE